MGELAASSEAPNPSCPTWLETNRVVRRFTFLPAQRCGSGRTKGPMTKGQEESDARCTCYMGGSGRDVAVSGRYRYGLPRTQHRLYLCFFCDVLGGRRSTFVEQCQRASTAVGSPFSRRAVNGWSSECFSWGHSGRNGQSSAAVRGAVAPQDRNDEQLLAGHAGA